ncbi:MAG TPA: winged helix-turn-helix domain-containing protein, partial [Methylococcales bacterium]
MKKIFSRTRIYEDIAFSIEEQISKGVLKAGMKLPTVKELADKHRVSVPTVLKAIALLKTRGIVKTIWGGGSYVQDTEKDKTLANTATIVVSNTETYNTDPKVRVYWDQIYSRNLLGIQSEAFHLGIRNSNIFLPETLLNAPDELRQFLAVHTKDA